MQVMNEIGAKRRGAAGQGDDAGEVVEDDEPEAEAQPVQRRAKVMPSSASGSTDTLRGPVLRDPIEVEDDASKPRAMFAPRKPAQSAPADRVPDNKRQVAYSKKLATLKASVGTGKAFAPGDAVTVERVGKLIGGSRKTVSALRNDLASAGLAHWKGQRLIAGAA